MALSTSAFPKKARLPLLLGSAAFVLAAPGTALAQASGSDGESFPAQEQMETGNQIVVTATKREQTLQEVPVAVTVTTAETLEREQIRDLKDLQTIVPSLRVTQLQAAASTNFIIRGFGNGANNAGIEPSVGVFVDGVYRSRTASQISDLPDVSRIEVLRGPQSTLFGKNASAGVISIVTREPSFKPEGMAELSVGYYNAIAGKAVVSGPIADNFAASLAGGFNTRDGYFRDLNTGSDVNNRNRWFVRGQGLFDNDGPLKVRIIADYDKVDEVCCGAVNVLSGPPTAAILALPGAQVTNPNTPFADQVVNNYDSTNLIENYGVSAQVDYELGAGKLTSITAYRRTNLQTNQDSDFTSARLLAENTSDTRLKTFTQELRFTTQIGENIDVLLGAYYFNEKVDVDNTLYYGDQFRPYANLLVQSATGGAFNVGSLNPMRDIELIFGQFDGNPTQYIGDFFANGQGLTEFYTLKNEAISAFGQVDFEVVPSLTLTLGGNYTKDSKTFTANASSTDVFSSIDFYAPQYSLLRQQLLYQGALGAGQSPTAAVQYAAANANNRAVNPLGQLRPLQYLPEFLDVPNSVEPGKTDDENFSYTIRAAYDLTDRMNLYASYATGFKASSVNLSRDSRPFLADETALINAGLVPGNQTYGTRFAGPEESEVIELGFKGNWGSYTANLTAFRQDINGFQSNIFTGTGFALANAGKQRTYGVEFESSARPIEPLTLNFAVTWLDPEYLSFPASAVGDLSGTRPAGIPEWTVVLGGQWNQELSTGDRVILRATYHWEDEVQIVDGLPGFLVTNPNTNQILDNSAALAVAQGFTREVNDLSASLTFVVVDTGFEFSIWGRNLLDDRYLLSIFDSVAQRGAVSGYPNQPATFGASARYRF